jgi:hypothetical protein
MTVSDFATVIPEIGQEDFGNMSILNLSCYK